MILAGMGIAFMPEYMPFLQGLSTRLVVEPEVMRHIELVTVAGLQCVPVFGDSLRQGGLNHTTTTARWSRTHAPRAGSDRGAWSGWRSIVPVRERFGQDPDGHGKQYQILEEELTRQNREDGEAPCAHLADSRGREQKTHGDEKKIPLVSNPPRTPSFAEKARAAINKPAAISTAPMR